MDIYRVTISFGSWYALYVLTIFAASTKSSIYSRLMKRVSPSDEKILQSVFKISEEEELNIYLMLKASPFDEDIIIAYEGIPTIEAICEELAQLCLFNFNKRKKT